MHPPHRMAMCISVTLVAMRLVRFNFVNQTFDDQKLQRFANSTAYCVTPDLSCSDTHSKELNFDSKDFCFKPFQFGINCELVQHFPLGYLFLLMLQLYRYFKLLNVVTKSCFNSMTVVFKLINQDAEQFKVIALPETLQQAKDLPSGNPATSTKIL